MFILLILLQYSRVAIRWWSYKDEEPVDEHVEEEDGVDCDDVLFGLDDHIHERNRP